MLESGFGELTVQHGLSDDPLKVSLKGSGHERPLSCDQAGVTAGGTVADPPQPASNAAIAPSVSDF